EELLSAFHALSLEGPQEQEPQESQDYRVLFQGRDLELPTAASALVKAIESGAPCFVRVTFRLLGGKGGFGSLLRSQKGGKKTTNFDAMRDLNGRRIRHVKAVERIKEWLEKKKRDDELVNLLTGEGPELPKPTPQSESLDPDYLRKLKQSASSRPGLVTEGLRRLLQEEEEASAEVSEAKRPRIELEQAEAAPSAKDEDEDDDGV
ncbi:unnamed protein product, partial [Effrenium voratum]